MAPSLLTVLIVLESGSSQAGFILHAAAKRKGAMRVSSDSSHTHHVSPAFPLIRSNSLNTRLSGDLQAGSLTAQRARMSVSMRHVRGRSRTNRSWLVPFQVRRTAGLERVKMGCVVRQMHVKGAGWGCRTTAVCMLRSKDHLMRYFMHGKSRSDIIGLVTNLL